MKTVFYTIIGDSHYHGCRTDEFIKSFKYFHPDIDLVVFGQSEIDKTFASDRRLNFYNSKATFAKKLYNDYDLVVNIDADHIILDRMIEILDGDYEVAFPSNYNVWLNSGLRTSTFATGHGDFHSSELIPYERYIQGGLIASRSKKFWEDYEYASINFSHLFGNKENDVLNILCHMLPYKTKVLEGHFEFNNELFTCWYGCSSLGREGEIVLHGDKVMLDNKPVRAYHFARGGMNKIHPRELFKDEVCNLIYHKILK